MELFQILYFNGSTPVFTDDGDEGRGFAAVGSSVSGFDFGVDPNLDPELALALRVSMEEERARQEAAAKRAAEEAGRQDRGEEPSSNAEDATMSDVNVLAPEENKKITDSAIDVSSTSTFMFVCVRVSFHSG